MKKTTLQTVVDVAQIASAVAVVASLVYVGSEFRRSRALSSTDVETLVYDRMLEMDRLLVENGEVAALVVGAEQDPDGLDVAQRERFLAYEHIFYDSWEMAWTAHSDGILDEDAWASWDSWFSAEVQRRPRLGWVGNRINHDAAFVAHVEGRLAARSPTDR